MNNNIDGLKKSLKATSRIVARVDSESNEVNTLKIDNAIKVALKHFDESFDPKFRAQIAKIKEMQDEHYSFKLNVKKEAECMAR
jgi:hypothetical protein